MARVEITKLIEAGAHFGHLTRRWNPKMKPYIFMEKNGIHIIDLKKTQKSIDVAAQALYNIVSTGKRPMFVGTKKQAKSVIAAEAKRCDANWVSERWLGGMLTNFQTIRKSVKRLQNIDKMESDGTFEKITKKEILFLTRERDKLRKVLDGVETMNRLPGALFIVDIRKEFIAVREAMRLNIPVFAIVDTNCDPDEIDYLIPANDDASRTIEVVMKAVADVVIEGNEKAKEVKAHEVAEKERERKEKADKGEEKRGRVRKVKFDNKGKKSENKEEVKAPVAEAKPAEVKKEAAPAEAVKEAPKAEEVKEAPKAEEKKEEKSAE